MKYNNLNSRLEIPLYIDNYIKLQKEIKELHTSVFKKFKNVFSGKNIVIIGNGPTSILYKQIKNAIHIGCGKSILNNKIKFDFYFLCDNEQSLFLYANSIDSCIKFYNIKPGIKWNSIVKNNYIKNAFNFYSDYERFNSDSIIHDDISLYPFIESTSVISAMQFALFCNPQRIYLVGCDVIDTDTTTYTHFYNAWIKLISYIKQKKYNIKIISINPCKLKGFFIDKYQNKLATYAVIYDSSGDSKKAILYAKKAYSISPNDLDVITILIKILIKNKKIIESIKILFPILNKNSDWAEGFKFLSHIYDMLDLKEKAIEAAQKAIKISPDDPILRNHLALLIRRYKNSKDALEEINKTNQPYMIAFWAVTLTLEGIAYLKKGKWDEGFLYYKEMAALPTDTFRLYWDFAEVLRRLGRWDLEEKVARDALNKDPTWQPGYWILACSYHARGNLKKAIVYALKAIRLDIYDLKIRGLLAYFFQRINKPDTAEILLKEALAIKPDWGDGYRRLALINEAKGKIDIALAFAEKAVQHEPARYWLRYDLARLYRKINKFSAAHAVIMEGFSSYSPNWSEGYMQLSLNYEHIGDIYNSIKYAKKAIECEQYGYGDILRYKNRLLYLLNRNGTLHSSIYLIKNILKESQQCGIGYKTISETYEQHLLYKN